MSYRDNFASALQKIETLQREIQELKEKNKELNSRANVIITMFSKKLSWRVVNSDEIKDLSPHVLDKLINFLKDIRIEQEFIQIRQKVDQNKTKF